MKKLLWILEAYQKGQYRLMILVRVLSARTFIIIRTIAIRIVIHMIIHFIPPKRYRSYYKENSGINQLRDCENCVRLCISFYKPYKIYMKFYKFTCYKWLYL